MINQYLVDNQRLSRELFYETLLRKFGNLDSIQLSEAPSLKAMAIKVGSAGRVTHSSAQPDLPEPTVIDRPGHGILAGELVTKKAYPSSEQRSFSKEYMNI